MLRQSTQYLIALRHCPVILKQRGENACARARERETDHSSWYCDVVHLVQLSTSELFCTRSHNTAMLLECPKHLTQRLFTLGSHLYSSVCIDNIAFLYTDLLLRHTSNCFLWYVTLFFPFHIFPMYTGELHIHYWYIHYTCIMYTSYTLHIDYCMQ